jgi:hypothetical protein
MRKMILNIRKLVKKMERDKRKMVLKDKDKKLIVIIWMKRNKT